MRKSRSRNSGGSLRLSAVAVCLASVVGLAHQTPAGASDWLRFRGPNGTGVSPDEAPLPVTWSSTENLSWKVPLPGPGSSSPIVVGDRVLITCWSGYGTEAARSASQSELRRHLICLSRKDGEELWRQTVEPVLPEDDFGGMFAEHGYASHTPVSDGERVYVYFGKTGAMAFSLDGEKLWQTEIGRESDPRGWGSASSPILYKNLLIVTASAESEALVGLDKLTGKEVWRQEAEGFSSTWGTPVLVDVSEDRSDLVLGVPYEIWGFNPLTGKLSWYCQAMDTDSYCSSVVADNGVVYGIEGRSGGSIAVRAGGKGDVAASHVVWSGRERSRIGTPLIIDRRIYFVAGGVVSCLDAASGDRIYQSRLQAAAGGPESRSERSGPGGGRRGGFGGQDYSSLVAGDGKLFFVSRSGDMHVLRLGGEFQQLAVNRVTADREDFSGTPAISDGQIFIRSDKHLYCVSLAGQGK